MEHNEIPDWDWISMGLMPQDRALMNFDTFIEEPGNRSAKSAAEGFVTEFLKWIQEGGRQTPGPFLLLYGPAGVGKTHLCYSIAWGFIEQGQSVRYRQAERLFDDLRASYDRGIYGRIMGQYLDSTLVIIDDIGAQSDTPWSMAKLDMIVDHRYRLRLPIVLTTNTLDLPARIADRLKEGRVRQIKGASWRGRKVKT